MCEAFCGSMMPAIILFVEYHLFIIQYCTQPRALSHTVYDKHRCNVINYTKHTAAHCRAYCAHSAHITTVRTTLPDTTTAAH
jgi:hypothetical protein